MERDKINSILSQGQIEETAGRRRIRLILSHNFKEYEKRMLCESGCPYTLPMHFITESDQDTAYYDFTGYLSLSDYMRREGTFDCRSRNSGERVCETLNLFIRILECIKGLERYLLFSERYSIHPDLIFVNPDNAQTAIAFYHNETPEITLQQRIIALLDSMGIFSSDADTVTYLERLKNTIRIKNTGLDGLISITGSLCRDAGYIYWNSNALREAEFSSAADRSENEKEEKKTVKDKIYKNVKAPSNRNRDLFRTAAVQGLLAAGLLAVFLTDVFDHISFAGLAIVVICLDIFILRKLKAK